MAMTKKPGFSSSVAAAASSEWPDIAVSILLKTYAQKFSVDRGYLRTQDWQEVAHAVNSACDNLKTLKQCRDKVDSLKRRYKMEKRKAVNGGEVCWPFFHRLDDIMNSVLKQGKGQHNKIPNCSSAHASADADDGDDVDYVDEVDELEEDGKEEEAGDGDGGGEEDDEEGADDDEEEKCEESNLHDSLSASSDSPPYMEDGKASGQAKGAYYISDEGVALNGFLYRQYHRLYDHGKNYGYHRQGHRHPHTRHHHPKGVYLDHRFLQPQLLPRSGPQSDSGRTQDSTENSSHGKADRARGRAYKRKLECDNGIDALADAVGGLSKPGSATSFSDVFARIELGKIEILKKVKLEIAKLEEIHRKSCSPGKRYRAISTSS